MKELELVEENIAQACRKAGRDRSEVKIVAVTKTHGPEVVEEAFAAGLDIIGENKVQEAMWKKPQCNSRLSWHLIGHLQTNKVRQALATFDYIHSVDSARLLDKLQAVAEMEGYRPRVLLEVNVAGEKSKSGMKIEDTPYIIEHAMINCPRIEIEGLMTMAPFAPEAEASRPYFRRLKELQIQMRKVSGLYLPELSMGMSGDYQVAVEEGATFVRLGTVLFGARPKLTRTVQADDTGVGGGLDSYSGEGPTYKIID